MGTRILKGIMASALAAAVTMGATATGAAPSAIYDAVPAPLPPNLPSLGYQATSTQEFGDGITFAGTDRRLTSVTVTMSDWALHSTYPTLPAAGYNHPITLNLYQAGSVGSLTPGALIASVTQSFLIPWRPEADPTCPGGTAWRAADHACYNGFAFNITFNLNQVVPNSIVYGIAYNTNTHGYAPIGAPGPYESLNVAINDSGPTVGTDSAPDAVYWNTSFGGFYTDGGANGTGPFRRDSGWGTSTPAVKFVASAPVATSKQVCSDNGWMRVARLDGSSFKNQGDCVSYTNNGK
ncbi:MAG: Ig domain protein group 1 domain protein [Acidimicrobiales bacterium]|nr:Ig domain protein group 1 domain protein [Acidimicrobiales bacterium]